MQGNFLRVKSCLALGHFGTSQVKGLALAGFLTLFGAFGTKNGLAPGAESAVEVGSKRGTGDLRGSG